MPVKIFFCYAREDELLLNKLKTHLSPLQRQGIITVWHDRDISAGTEWEQEVSEQLNTADIILLLVSPDFIHSDYCYSIEMKRALERHDKHEACVVPIILRPVYWQQAPFGKLQVLPTDTKPVKSWSSLDKAFFNVVEGIHKVVEELTIKRRTKEQWLASILDLYKNRHYEETLAACEQAIQFYPTLASLYYGKGLVLNKLKQYGRAIEAFERSVELDPTSAALAYGGKGCALHGFRRYSEALVAFERSIHLDPNSAVVYNDMGLTLLTLKRYSEALIAFERSIQLNPNLAAIYNNKGMTLLALERYEEALFAFEQSIQLDPHQAAVYLNKKLALEHLGMTQPTDCATRLSGLDFADGGS